jgi:hypothetical protein
MAAAYFSYILTIAFWPRLLGLPLWNGTVVTWGFLIGVGLIALRVRADGRLRRAGELPLRSSQPTSSGGSTMISRQTCGPLLATAFALLS